jgi:UDP-glucose 4-epimerase
MKAILITGAAGFIGSAVVNALKNKPFRLVLVDNLSKGRLLNLGNLSNQLIVGDLSNLKFVQSLPRVDVILHLAGQSSGERSMESPEMDLNDNYISTINIADYARRNDVRSIIFSSSMSVYGNGDLIPMTNYASHKLASEFYLLNNLTNISVSVLRFFNIYGPGQDLSDLKQGMVSIFIAQALQSNSINVRGSLERKRDFVYIADLVDFFIEVFEERFQLPTGFSVNDIASGQTISVRQLLAYITEIWGSKVINVLDGTPGDQFEAYSKSSILESALKRPTTKIYNGLRLWKEKMK